MSCFVQIGDVTLLEETVSLLASAGLKDFHDFMDFPGGERICHKRGRSVYRFSIGDRVFYLKRNVFHKVEFWKRASRLRLPPRSAKQEWESILALTNLGIPTVKPVALGEKTFLGFETTSFTLTEEIYGAEPLDTFLLREFSGPLSEANRQKKRHLIRKVAELAARFHGRGFNHQDFYLNHFFLNSDGTLFLLDLQRVQQRRAVSPRFQIKDLGQLNYSADYLGGFTRGDRMRFLHAYFACDHLTPGQKGLVRRVAAKTARIARHDVKLLARRRRRGELPPEA